MKVSTDAPNYEARLADALRTARDVVRRRLLTLLIVAGVVAVVGIVLTLQITPVYSGVTRIQIDPTRNPLARTANEAQAQLASEAIETEVSVLNSVAIARQVVQRLGLERDPEFAEGLDEAIKKGEMTQAARLEAVVNRVRTGLSVSREKLTYIIGIHFSSQEAGKAARISNAFATAYLDAKVGSNIGTAERQFTFFQKRLDELANEARVADAKVAQYKSEFGILSGGGQDSQQRTIVDQQIVPLTIQVAQANAAAASSKADLAQAEAQVRLGRLDSVSDVLMSDTIVDLRRQHAEVSRGLGDIEERYGPRHPETMRFRDQLVQLDRQLNEQSQRVIGALQAKANSSSVLASSLRGDMRELEGKQASSVRASVVADSLQREADSAHTAYDRMAQLAFETRQASQNSIAQAKIIDAAEAPQVPSWPNRPLLILLSLIVGVGAGIATVTIQELMVSGMRSVEDVERALGVPLLGAIPAMRKIARPADLLIEKPTSQFAEALRNTRASILGVKSDTKPRVIALTSAMPGEGKSTTALSLARTMAVNGARTIILDVDVRRAQLRQILGTPSTGPGTVDLLRGEASLEQAIETSDVDNLDHIIVNKPYFSSENLFGNDAMPNLLAELADRYDVIVLDLPPLLGLADGRFLAALADAVVMVIKWDATPQHAVSTALNSLRADGSNVIGAIYTMVDTSSESVGAYYYYSKRYSTYYDQSTT